MRTWKQLEKPFFYFITDTALSALPPAEQVERALGGGADIIQYREKKLPPSRQVPVARDIRRICERYGKLFIVNDFPEVAVASGAHGVHVGRSDMPLKEARKIIGEEVVGVTVSSAREAAEAEKNGADYLGASPVFGTSTKADAGEPIGLEGLSRIVMNVSIPVVGIGGITMENAAEVMKAGASGVAAISAVLKEEDIAEAVKKFKKILRESA